MTDDQKEFVALAEEIIARIEESRKDPVSNSWPIFGVEGSTPNCWWHDLTGMSESLEILRRRIQPREEGKPWDYPAFLVTELGANHPPKDITAESLFSKHFARLQERLREKDYIAYMVMLTRDPLVNKSDKIRPISTLIQNATLNPETNKLEGLEYKIDPDINEYTEHAVTILRRWIRVMSMQPSLADTFRDSPGGCLNEDESPTADKPRQVDLARLGHEIYKDLTPEDVGKEGNAQGPPGDKIPMGKGNGGSEKTKKKRDRAEWLGKVLVLRKRHPDWSKTRLAEEVGKHSGNLVPKRCPELADLEDMLKRKPRPGHIVTDPDSGQSDVVGVTPPGDKQGRGSPIGGSNLFREYCAECDEPIRVAEGQVGEHPLCENCAG